MKQHGIAYLNGIHVNGLLLKGETWNPTTGCTAEFPCWERCWARGMAKRLEGMSKEHPERYRGFSPTFWPERLDTPLRWRKPRAIAVSFMGDLFHDNMPLHDIRKIMITAAVCERHLFLFLTKRPLKMYSAIGYSCRHITGQPWPPKHLWFGVSISTQADADERIPHLLQVPAAVRWVSLEPLLEPVNMRWLCKDIAGHSAATGERVTFRCGLRWIVVGCESGSKRRSCDPEWVHDVVKQCVQTEVPCYVKQLDIDGKCVDDPNHPAWPAWAVRQFPKENVT